MKLSKTECRVVAIALFVPSLVLFLLLSGVYYAYKTSPPPLELEPMPPNLGVLAVYSDRYVCAERAGNVETIRKVTRDAQTEMPAPCSCEYDETMKFPVGWESVSDLLCLADDQGAFCVYLTANEDGGRALSALDMKSGETLVLLQQVASEAEPCILLQAGAGEFVLLQPQENWSAIKLIGFKATRTPEQKLTFDTRELFFRNPAGPGDRYQFELSRFDGGYRGIIRSGITSSLFVISDTGELDWKPAEESANPTTLAPDGERAIVRTGPRTLGLGRVDWDQLRVYAVEEFKLPGQRLLGWSPDARFLIVGEGRLSGAYLNFYDFWEERVSHELQLRPDNHMLPSDCIVWTSGPHGFLGRD